MKRIKNLLILLGIYILTIPTKIFAIDTRTGIGPLYGIDVPAEVRNPMINPVIKVWDIIKKLYFIPIALLVGIIMYFIKSKASVKKKIFVIFIFLCFLVAIVAFFKNS